MKDNIIVWDEEPKVISVIRGFMLDKQEKIAEAKQIAAKHLNAEYVDGINLYIDNQYYGGIYCDDVALYKYHKRFNLNLGNSVIEVYGPLVIINELGSLDSADCRRIIDYLKACIEK